MLGAADTAASSAPRTAEETLSGLQDVAFHREGELWWRTALKGDFLQF